MLWKAHQLRRECATACKFRGCPDVRRSWPTYDENFISDSEVAALASRIASQYRKTSIKVPEDFEKKRAVVESSERMAGRVS